ncbi:hypothetical protein Q9L58_009211 [Maublancomyces gigas]|uniref:Uncharacterized protein n=1 Tax=Discina gigas TaxID=1032678 RepID=A0ABR3G7K3_9PEZI
MNSTLYDEPIIEVHREDVVCWTTNWKDITKFLLFNFVLHAITVLSSPGDGILLATSNKLICLCMPLCGMGKAITTIYRFSYGQKTPLQKALRAGALCRVLPDRIEITFKDQLKDVFRCCTFFPAKVLATCPSIMPEKRDKPDPVGRQISTTVKIIHGQHPVEREGRWRWLWNFIHQGSDIQEYLVVVPPNFKVLPPLIDGGEFEIAYNYSMTKAVAAIAQILYGTFQLFQSAKPQLDYYGYNAYQLTIIPYIIMSFLNLIASLCEPQFPALYLVDYELVAVTPNSGGAAGPVDRISLEHGVVDTPKTSGVVGTIAKDSDTKARSIFSIRRKDDAACW